MRAAGSTWALVFALAAACDRPVAERSSGGSTTPAQGRADLILRLSVEPAGAVGYGWVYAGAVQQVVRGRLDGRELRMTVLASDQATEAFLASHAAPAVIEASFTRDRRDEPYQTRAFTGFVDDARTSWRLVHVE